MEEIWKDIVGYEGRYQVSSLGNVMHIGRGLLKPQKHGKGYLSVWLYDGHNNSKQFDIHRLVANMFIPNPNGLLEVNHIDEDKENNCVLNLEWCSHKYNSSYGDRGEKISSANTNGKRSRPIEQYSLDGKLVAVYPSLQEASRNGYSASNICRCAKGDPKYSHAYGYKWQYAN